MRVERRIFQKRCFALDGGNGAFSNRVLVETNFGVSKTLYLKAFQSLKNCLD